MGDQLIKECAGHVAGTSTYKTWSRAAAGSDAIKCAWADRLAPWADKCCINKERRRDIQTNA